MKVGRIRRAPTDSGIRVSGAGDKKFPSLGSAIAFAMTAAFKGEPGTAIEITEYDDVIGRAVRTEEGASWEGGT